MSALPTERCVYCFGAGSIVDSAYLTRNVERVVCSVCKGSGVLVNVQLSSRRG